MSKILFLGVYRDPTGWGQAARDYILALDAAGVDVVCRPVLLSTHRHPIGERLEAIEARSSRGCDVVLQHVPPHLMDYHGGFASNIGMFATETSDFAGTGWAERANRMDSLWVFNGQSAAACRRSGVTVPVRVVPHTRDVSLFEKRYEPLREVLRLKERGDFVFYTVGEMVRRKNLSALLKAFHTEFAPEEPVSLVIKTSMHGLPPSEVEKHVRASCEQVKSGLGLYGTDTRPYKSETVLAGRSSDDDVLRLHASCDCFVQPSYGEAWSQPAFDAMGMGKTPIVTDATGYCDYMTHWAGWLVPARDEPVVGADDPFGTCTGRQTWASADHAGLRAAMREAYQDEGVRLRKAEAGVVRARDFSFEKVGALMRGALCHEQAERDRRGRGS